jgi:hypothetical protein
MILDSIMIWGVSFSLLFLPFSLVSGLAGTPWLIALSFPHFVATYVVWARWVRSWRQEWWPLLFPFLFLGAVFASGAYFGPAIKGVIFKLTYVYLLYHFGQQLYGVALWGGYKQKFALRATSKWVLRSWFLLLPFSYWYQQEISSGVTVVFYQEVIPFRLPEMGFTVLLSLIGVNVLALLAAAFFDYQKKPSKGVLWILAVAALPVLWFLPPFQRAEWIPLIPLLHAVQYMPFWSRMIWKEKTPWYYRPLVYGLFVAVGWLLFRYLPMGQFAAAGRLDWVAAWIAMLNAHHFVIDGRIWKLRDEKNGALF